MGSRTGYLLLIAVASACAHGVGDTPDATETQRDAAEVVPTDAAVVDAAAADACVALAEESCDGTDEDCDGEIDEGFEVGQACDGDDEDLCLDDVILCSEDGVEGACVDQGPALVEICNNLDDDCRADTLDGSADPGAGGGCDGPDSDLCLEGSVTCSQGSLQCSDLTGSTADVCNGLDDDCDLTSVDGSEDAQVGVVCDGSDGDLCTEGIAQCSAGALVCTDQTTTTVEICNGLDDDCDGSIDEDFPRDTNPLCTGSILLGSVSGDLGPNILTVSGTDERWFRVRITENSFSTSSYLSARVDLQSPTNMDFDLFVYCASCGGTLSGSSTLSSGLLDSVDIRRNDGALDESFDVLIEVRFFGATTCSTWDLTVTSDTAVAAQTCAI